MKDKLLKLLFLIITIVFIVLLSKSILIPFGQKLAKNIYTSSIYISPNTVTKDKFNSFKYAPSKSTNETIGQKEALIEIAQELDAQPNKPNNNVLELVNFDALQSFCPDYKTYFAIKLKVKNAVLDLHNLLNNNTNLSSNSLNKYFIENSAYLDKVFGITTVAELDSLIKYCKDFNNYSNFTIFIEPSSIICNSGDTYLNFTVYLINNDVISDDKVSLNVKVQFRHSTNNQVSPYVSVLGPTGGVS